MTLVQDEDAGASARLLRLQHLTAWDDGKRITRVAFTLADHHDLNVRSQWVDANLCVELALSRNGALLREEILALMRDKLAELAADYGRLVRP